MFVRVILAVLIGLFSHTMGQLESAAAQGAPAARSYVGESRSNYRIYFFGDKLAGGLWAGFSRVTKGDRRIRPEGRFREGSGLIRQRTYNWPRAAEKILASNQIDIAVFMLGSNDARNFPISEGGQTFGSIPWRRAYRARVKALIEPFVKASIPVYMVELPPMRSPDYDEKIKVISEVQESIAQELQLRHISIRKAFSLANGGYTDQGIDLEGNTNRLRSRNGIHFIRVGNNKLAALVLNTISRDIDVADGVRSAQSVALPKQQNSNIAQGDLPVFGYADINAENQLIPAASLPDPKAVFAILQSRLAASGGSVSGDKLLDRLRAVSPRGSSAETLFTTGVWSQAPQDRIDNFRWSPSRRRALQ